MHRRIGKVSHGDCDRNDSAAGRQVPDRHHAARLFGLSAGGFFASWAIFQPNTPFTKYIISSPAMAYGRGEIFRQEAAYAKAHKDLAVGIYLASGVLEAGDPMLEGIGEIVSGMSHLAGVLASRQYPGLKMTIEFHPGMGHADVMGTSVVRGLRSLYAK